MGYELATLSIANDPLGMCTRGVLIRDPSLKTCKRLRSGTTNVTVIRLSILQFSGPKLDQAPSHKRQPNYISQDWTGILCFVVSTGHTRLETEA